MLKKILVATLSLSIMLTSSLSAGRYNATECAVFTKSNMVPCTYNFTADSHGHYTLPVGYTIYEVYNAFRPKTVKEVKKNPHPYENTQKFFNVLNRVDALTLPIRILYDPQGYADSVMRFKSTMGQTFTNITNFQFTYLNETLEAVREPMMNNRDGIAGMIQMIGGPNAELLVGRIYGATDTLGAATLAARVMYDPISVTKTINKMHDTPITVDDALSVYYSRFTFLSSVRFFTRETMLSAEAAAKNLVFPSALAAGKRNAIVKAAQAAANAKTVRHNSIFTAFVSIPAVDVGIQYVTYHFTQNAWMAYITGKVMTFSILMGLGKGFMQPTRVWVTTEGVTGVISAVMHLFT